MLRAQALANLPSCVSCFTTSPQPLFDKIIPQTKEGELIMATKWYAIFRAKRNYAFVICFLLQGGYIGIQPPSSVDGPTTATFGDLRPRFLRQRGCTFSRSHCCVGGERVTEKDQREQRRYRLDKVTQLRAIPAFKISKAIKSQLRFSQPNDVTFDRGFSLVGCLVPVISVNAGQFWVSDLQE